jgi:hypothetical protein
MAFPRPILPSDCHPPTFPSDVSWDILCPVPELPIATLTRPLLAEQSNLQKAALVQMKELAERETRYITSLPSFHSFQLVIINSLDLIEECFLEKKYV